MSVTPCPLLPLPCLQGEHAELTKQLINCKVELAEARGETLQVKGRPGVSRGGTLHGAVVGHRERGAHRHGHGWEHCTTTKAHRCLLCAMCAEWRWGPPALSGGAAEPHERHLSFAYSV